MTLITESLAELALCFSSYESHCCDAQMMVVMCVDISGLEIINTEGMHTVLYDSLSVCKKEKKTNNKVYVEQSQTVDFCYEMKINVQNFRL